MIELFHNIRRRRKIRSTNAGRKDGWLVERQGISILKLVDPRFFDMFWFQYTISITDNSIDGYLDQEFWEDDSLKFWSIAIEEYSEYDPIVNILNSDQLQVIVRGLYIV